MNCAITTKDNPYSPFDNFDKWFLYDVGLGYNTCGKLARFAEISDALTEKENDEIIENAIDTVVLNDFLGIYKKIYDTPRPSN